MRASKLPRSRLRHAILIAEVLVTSLSSRPRISVHIYNVVDRLLEGLLHGLCSNLALVGIYSRDLLMS